MPTKIDYPLTSSVAEDILRNRDQEMRKQEDAIRIAHDHAMWSITNFVTKITGAPVQLTEPVVRIESFTFSPVPGCPYVIQVLRHCAVCDEPTILCTIQSSASREAILQRLAAHEADKQWVCCECREAKPTIRAVTPTLAVVD
jgi:hypothetical protein